MNRVCICFEQNIELHSSGTFAETVWALAHSDHERRETLYKAFFMLSQL